MKVGDLVKVNENHWRQPGMIGIIVSDLANRGKAFKVLFSDGKLTSKLQLQLEKLNEN